MSQLTKFNISTGAVPVQTVTGNTGGPVTPDGSGNISIVGAGVISVDGNAGTNTETITLSNGTDGQLLIGGGVGPAWNTVTSSDSTITFTPGANTLDMVVTAGTGAHTFPTDSGTATEAAGSLEIHGGASGLISTAGASNQVTIDLDNGTNGQVIIGGGATPAWASLTSTGGSITFTPGANTLNLEAVSPLINESKIIYVGKHGNDLNSGFNIENAKLTFGAAIVTATIYAPAVVWCFDEGTYTEDLTGVDNVDIFAPNATIIGTHTIANENHWKFNRAEVPDGNIGFLINVVGGTAFLWVDQIDAIGGAICFACINGDLQIECNEVTIADGFVIASITAGNVRVISQRTTITGTGFAIGSASGGHISWLGNQIFCGLAGTAVFTTAGATCEVTINVNEIETTILSNIDAATLFFVVVAYLEGVAAEIGAGVAKSIISGQKIRVNGSAVFSPDTGVGSVSLVNSTGVKTNVITTAATSDWTFTLPVDGGGAPGLFLQTDGSGNTSWAASSSSFPWTEITGATVALAANNGYIMNRATSITATLPATCAQGAIIRIAGKGVGLTVVDQNLGQTIHFGNLDTTISSGTLTATNKYDVIELLCITADTDFSVLSAQGNWSVA